MERSRPDGRPIAVLCFLLFGGSTFADAAPSTLRQALETELTRTMEELKSKPVPLYFLAFAVYDRRDSRIATAFGVATDESEQRVRLLRVEIRVGDHELDNTHRIRSEMHARFAPFAELPVDDDVPALRDAIWRETERRYREAVEDLSRIRADRQVKVEAQDASPDFSREDPVVDTEPPAAAALDRKAWRERLRRFSAVFTGDPLILHAQATLEVTDVRRTLVTSEGTRLETSDSQARLALYAMTLASDGMELPRFETYFAFDPRSLPDDRRVLEDARHMAADLGALRDAPLLEPYTGPAILSGRAAGVFFHEIFGHRVEGQRQKDEEEAQTFTKMIGEVVLPQFLGVVFDPTRKTLGSRPLSGYYRYDDEGVPARPVRAVENGVLTSFLMSRSPVEGFPKSNGHGRSQPGAIPAGRQSNLIVEASRTFPVAELRQMLRDHIRQQGKPFGILFEDIAGGFTFTGRGVPNAFAVQPVKTWRVYADDRPDELVRGADLIGTPLTSFSRIVAAGDDLATFNGVCGAESGWVPVSASAPSLLIEQIEVQKQETPPDRPPILPAPSWRR